MSSRVSSLYSLGSYFLTLFFSRFVLAKCISSRTMRARWMWACMYEKVKQVEIKNRTFGHPAPLERGDNCSAMSVPTIPHKVTTRWFFFPICIDTSGGVPFSCIAKKKTHTQNDILAAHSRTTSLMCFVSQPISLRALLNPTIRAPKVGSFVSVQRRSKPETPSL